jgi:hypothetical protein
MTEGQSRCERVAVLLGPVLVSAGVSAYLLSRPHFLFGIHVGSGYDEGVYLSAIQRFVHGQLPYRHYTFLQPPGILILFSPLGVVSRVFGTADAMAVGRLLTLVMAAGNAALATHLLRSYGRAAQLSAGLIVAAFPLNIRATNTMLLEPPLVMAVLLGAWLAFDGTSLVRTRRLAAAGAMVGLAAQIKVWGLAAAVAVLIACLPDWRRVRAAATGMVLSGLVISGTFIVAAPANFWHQIVTAQLWRHEEYYPLRRRLAMIIGVWPSPSASRAAVVAVVVAAVVVIIAAAFVGGRAPVNRFERFVLVNAALTVAGLLVARQFYDHYVIATTAALALVLGVAVGRLSRRAGTRLAFPLSHTGTTAAGVVVFAALTAAALLRQAPTISHYANGNRATPAAIGALIPAGTCSITDDPEFLVEANRWTASSECDPVTDPFGVLMSADGQPPPRTAPFPASIRRAWLGALRQAQYVVLQSPSHGLIPFGATFGDYFLAHFRQLNEGDGIAIYVRDSRLT